MSPDPGDAVPADAFVPGFIGEPGARTFYLQVGDGGSTSWYVLEKAQVAAFAIEAARLLAAQGLTGTGMDADVPELTEPDTVAFRVGDMRLGMDAESGLVSVELEPTDDTLDPVRFFLTTAQLDAASRRGAHSVAQGRPRCPRCGLAVDPDGHVCPATNGDLRHHRP